MALVRDLALFFFVLRHKTVSHIGDVIVAMLLTSRHNFLASVTLARQSALHRTHGQSVMSSNLSERSSRDRLSPRIRCPAPAAYAVFRVGVHPASRLARPVCSDRFLQANADKTPGGGIS